MALHKVSIGLRVRMGCIVMLLLLFSSMAMSQSPKPAPSPPASTTTPAQKSPPAAPLPAQKSPPAAPIPAQKSPPAAPIPAQKSPPAAPAPVQPPVTTPASPTPLKAPTPSSPAPGLAPAPAPSAKSSSPGISNGTLDPSQIAALQELKVPVPPNPCAGSHSTMICDESTPFRRLLFLQLQYCPADATLSEEALKNLTGLQALSFSDCPMKPSVSLPTELVRTLTSFSCVSSLGKTTGFESMPGLSGVWLSRLHRVQDLTVMNVMVNASSLSVILANMTELRELKVSNTSLRGPLPKSWPQNLTSVDLSLNAISGPLPSFFGELEQLQSLDLTGNNLTGRMPESIGRLRSLQRLSLSSNGLTGGVPGDALANMTTLTYLDLSGNKLNGTVPVTLSRLADLRYLDLRNNELTGVLPFNSSFLGRLNSFKASGNQMLCYNSSVTSAKLVMGIPPCDESGRPVTSSSGPAMAPGEDMGPTSEPADSQERTKSKKHGPKTIVWAVATALGAIFLAIALLVAFSKWCRWKEA